MIKSKFRNIKAVIFDGDGVLTDNRVLEGLPDSKPRWRSHYDGQGISLLRAIGIRICFITNETEASAQAIEGLVDRWNRLPSAVKDGDDKWTPVALFTGCAGDKKVEKAELWLSAHGLSWGDCAVMGDDLVDVPMLKRAGLSVAPSSAEQVVRKMVDLVTERPGGFGAVRDFANAVLEASEIDPTTLPTQ